jgi:hypothetical protein
MAAQDYNGVVQQLYISYFGRPADYYGLQNFSNALAAIDTKGELKTFAAVNAAVQADKAGTSALSKLVNSFNTSTESGNLYGTDNSQIGISKFVAAIYQNVLGREADKTGFDFWVNAITTGTLTKANAAASITAAALVDQSAQGKIDAVTVQNKLAVATSFTTAIDTPTEINAYSGDVAAAAARALLAGVNNATSLTAYQANVDAAINNMINVPGVTVSLTAGVDTLPGTSNNDAFNALSVAADGTPGSTLGNFDSIDGGAGKDTLNIYTDAVAHYNDAIAANTTIKNVETVNIFNANGAATGLADASQYAGVTALWQIGAAANVTNLASTTTAGFRGITGAGVTLGVAAVDAATTASVALDGVTEGSTVNVTSGTAGKLASVTLSGNVADGADAGSTAGNVATNLAVTVGKDVQTLTVNTSINTNLSFSGQVASTKAVTTIAAGASTGAITYADTETTVASITTGSGDDDVTIVTATLKDDAATTADETISATVNTGAGDDFITVKTTGTGIVTVNAGAGDDAVDITTRGTALLNVTLGDGDDSFTSSVEIGANDKIDAGAGTDMLLLSLVGSANVGAFSNFDAFDAAGMGKALDVNILAAKNTVTEIVASADVGTSAELTNLAAGVGFRVVGDMGTANALTLTQKTGGALTVTVDADEATTADTAIDTVSAKVIASNATSLNAVFGTSYKAGIAGEVAAGDNVTTLQLSGAAATSLSIVSGGSLSSNVLAYADTATGTNGKLATITITGDQVVTLSNTFAATNSALTTVDSGASKGGLIFSMANLKDGGNVILGSGIDSITVTGSSKVGGVESITGFEKTAAVAVSTAAGDATSKAAVLADADTLVLSGASVAADVTGSISKGVLSFSGTGPSTLAAAALTADGAAATAGNALVFEYLGNSYVFVQGGAVGTADDTLVQLTGVTGITNLGETGTDHFFIV